MALTELDCRHAKPQANAYRMWDGKGLYLDVLPSGNRVWRKRYKIHGKEKLLTLGAYPATSLVQARESRDTAQAQIHRGIDPSAAKLEAKRLARYQAAQTFKEVATQWHTDYGDRWSKRYRDTMMARLEKHVFPFFGCYPISDLDAPMIYACVQKIEARKTGEMSRRVLQIISQVMRYAIITGRAKENATVHLRGALKPYTKGHYAAISIDELPTLLDKLRRNEARLYRQTMIAMWLMLYTFVRTNELMEARWSEFDLEKAEWHIPAGRMKMGKPHFVPLSQQSVKLLRELRHLNLRDTMPETDDAAYILPSITKAGRPMSNTALLMALRRMNYSGKMTGHGFRSLAMSTIKEQLGYRHEVVDRQLAHVPRKKVDQAYDRALFVSERKEMMQRWADLIEEL